ncbi:MAG TPA: Hpt domain-containing protein [Longimicrobiales bacterium]
MPSTREFFLMEARECLARLNALLGSADDALVPAAELHRVARTLRGSAQMARETRVQNVAHAVEIAGRSLVQGALAWGRDLRNALEATLADLAILVEAGEDEARLEERAAAAVERWERLGLELPPLPDAPPARAAAEGGRARPPGPSPAPGAAQSEDLPVEVVNFFRGEAGALVDRIERLAGGRARSTADRQGTLRRELKDTVVALRDLAGTFGFAHSAAAAERLLEAIEQERPAVGLLADVRRLVTSEVPGQPSSLAPRANAAAAPGRTPEPRPAADIVPIEDLLYRGEAALRRALELRPAIERAVGADPAAREAVEELFDLIRLGLP